VLRAPELEAGLQVRSHHRGVERMDTDIRDDLGLTRTVLQLLRWN